MKKIQKGQYGYISHQKKITIIRTIALFVIAFAILITGFYYTGTKSNALTIIAILGMLPASKSAVNMIMFLRFHDCDKALYSKCSEIAKGLPMNYDLVFTMPDHSYQVQLVAVGQGCICGYQKAADADVKKVQEHIRMILNQNQLKHIEVKIWNDYEAFLKRLNELQDKYTEDQDEQNQTVLALLHAISL